jgi:hypothetical protein
VTILDIIGNALKLCLLVISEAIDLAKQHDAAVDGALKRRALFEQAVTLALQRLWLETTEEKRQADAVDEAVDEETKKP